MSMISSLQKLLRRRGVKVEEKKELTLSSEMHDLYDSYMNFVKKHRFRKPMEFDKFTSAVQNLYNEFLQIDPIDRLTFQYESFPGQYIVSEEINKRGNIEIVIGILFEKEEIEGFNPDYRYHPCVAAIEMNEEEHRNTSYRMRYSFNDDGK